MLIVCYENFNYRKSFVESFTDSFNEIFKHNHLINAKSEISVIYILSFVSFLLLTLKYDEPER